MRSRVLGAALAVLLLAPPALAQNLALHEMAAALTAPVITGKFAGNPLSQSRGEIVLSDAAVTLATVTNGRSTPVRLQVDVIATDTTRRALPASNGKIAFARQGGIFLMNSDGTGQMRLTSGRDIGPVWSPDGTRVAFARDNLEIYVINADGTGETQLTTMFDSSPVWSPDGTRIAFGRQVPPTFTPEIFVMDADGSNQTRLTNTLGSSLQAWSPDGTQIAFSSSRIGEGTEIYVVNVDGSGESRLTDTFGANLKPDWSPDGTQIAFNSTRDSALQQIWVMNADGSDQTRVTTNAFADANAFWSPKGTQLAFNRVDVNGTGFGRGIHLINADGSNETRLTVGASDQLGAWSPDGTQITFGRFLDGIFVVNADGSGETRLTNLGDDSPDWAPRTLASPSADAWRSTSFTCDLTGRETTTFVFTPPGGGPTNPTDRAELYVECSDPDDPNGDPRSFLLPGQTGLVFIAAADPQTGATLGQDILFGEAVVVDLIDGQAYSFGAIPFQAGLGQNDGDKVYRFDGQEYARFPSVLATNFVTPNGAGVNAELILFTLDGTTGSTPPPRARLGGYAYNDDEQALDFQHEFDCFDIVALDDVNPNLVNTPGGAGLGTLSGHLELVAQPTATANDVHDDQYGDGNDTRTRPVHGWIVQQVRANGTLVPAGQPIPAQGVDVPNAGGAAAWGRPLAQSRTAAVPFRNDDPATLDADVLN